MRTFFAAVAILASLSWGIAGACPALPNSGGLPVLGIGSAQYYCANRNALMDNPPPAKLGDLSPAGWGSNVQICSKNCSYAPVVPSDPDSELVPVSCGGGDHDMPYYVEPPPPAKGVTAIRIASPSCTGVSPSKAPPRQPAPRRQEQVPSPKPSSRP